MNNNFFKLTYMAHSNGSNFDCSYSYKVENYINVNLISEIEPHSQQITVANKIYTLSRIDFDNLMKFLHI